MSPDNSIPELNYVEDPETTEVIREISTRWPEIGKAADHPLTEFFIRRSGRPGVLVPALYQMRFVVFLVIITGPLWYMPVVNNYLRLNIFSLKYWMILALICAVLGCIHLVLTTRKKARAMASPEEMISKDPEQNCFIWLSGLSLPEFIATSFAHHYWQAHGIHRLRYRVCLIFVAADLLLALMADHFYFHFSYFPERLVIGLLEFIPLGIVTIFYFCDPAVMVRACLWRAATLIGNNEYDYVDHLDIYFQVMLAGMALIFLNHGNYFIALAGVIFASVWIELSRRKMTKRISRKYESILQEQTKFMAVLAPGQIK